jgi:hypothetical protein
MMDRTNVAEVKGSRRKTTHGRTKMTIIGNAYSESFGNLKVILHKAAYASSDTKGLKCTHYQKLQKPVKLLVK